MIFFYNISILLYNLLIRFAAIFNAKARLWCDGRKNIFQQIENKLKSNEHRIWFHAASLGEFEQGRPVIEAFRENFPDYKIVLTFFSPSGYEVRKSYAGADYIFYLPSDTPSNANRFISLIQPKMVFFVKYEFWYNYLKIASNQNIPIYLFSAIFRRDQVFFKWYGRWYKNILFLFNHIFVQNPESMQLLNKFNILQTTVAGDTRFDRVFQIAAQAKVIPIVEKFKNSQTTIIAGSVWPPDEEIICRFINQSQAGVKFIVVPHEIHTEHIDSLMKSISRKVIKFSKASDESCSDADVLIIDNVGMLSSLYQYANIAYIGGGFGVGIHNTLEAATFGLPIIFGPVYHKFKEARDLIELQAAFSISDYMQLESIFNDFLNNPFKISDTGLIAKKYVQTNKGATKKIIDYIATIPPKN